ncbi:hypothetical protein F5X68DRAFT_25055 [Plectosphaerella plurivora]|uniref:Suppressor of anucleate metulae protein B n=1 Tax=Plectosphaerella plurivora TaxID=936078 RepID=A0A9P8V5W4_9PEZI|nr:hypothetical protein F5X68DRAFT_25055 [Plectosphaerella plurivora]
MPPYTISPSPRGRALIASHALEPGTLIDTFTDSPPTRALVLPATPSRSTTCAHCLTSSPTLKRCTACRSVAYCSPACQKTDWKVAHKQECPVLVRAAASVGKDVQDGAPVPTAVRAAIRILLAPAAYGRLDTELNGHFENFEEEKGVKWEDLELQARVLMGWLPAMPEGEEATKRRVMNILCKIQTNAFSRSEAETGQDGIFMHPTLAMVNHSCVPNAVIAFGGRKALLRVLRPIKSGEEVEISYIDCTQPLAQRQRDLAHYHFTCTCPRCEGDLDNYAVAAKTPIVKRHQVMSLVPGLDYSKPRPSSAGEDSEALEKIKQLLPPSGTGSYGPTERHRQLSRAYRASEALRCQDRWANEPNGHFLAEAISYYVGLDNFEAALAVSSLAATESDPFKYTEPFHPLRLHGCMKLVKGLSNTAPRGGALAAFAKRALTAAGHSQTPLEALAHLDQLSLIQMMLFLIHLHAPMGHSEEWQVYQEGLEMLTELDSLPGREQENGIIRSWAQNPGDPKMQEFFRYGLVAPVAALAAVGKATLEADFGKEGGL